MKRKRRRKKIGEGSWRHTKATKFILKIIGERACKAENESRLLSSFPVNARLVILFLLFLFIFPSRNTS